jgi:hypothetical protein
MPITLVILLTQSFLKIRRRYNYKRRQSFIRNYLKIFRALVAFKRPIICLVNKTPVAYNGCKNPNRMRRKKKAALRVKKFNGPD